MPRSVSTGSSTASRNPSNSRPASARIDCVACLPVGRTAVGTVVPLLHPSYQEVWLSRLGHTRASYVETLADCLDSR